MDQKAALIGGVLVALGVAGGGYAYWRFRQGQAAIQSVGSLGVVVTPLPLPLSASLATVKVNWTNPTGAEATYGVQGAWLEELQGQNGVIAGHLLVSQTLAQQAHSNPSAAAGIVTNPADRIQVATAVPGSPVSASLYGYVQPGALVGPVGLVLWIVAHPPSGKLLSADPVGANVSQTSAVGRHISEPLAVV